MKRTAGAPGASAFTGVFTSVRTTEVAPPAFYVLLHFWINILGSDSEWTMRLLSVLAGFCLLAATWWLGRLVSGDAVAGVAATMAALSPLVVEYAQEVRAYIFAMLFTVLAVAAAVAATHDPARARGWVGLSAAASVAAMWTHYTSFPVLAALAVFIWTERRLTAAARHSWLLVSGIGFVIIVPLMVIQLRAGHQGGVAPFAQPTVTNFARVIGTPFDGRFAPRSLSYLTGAAAVAAALAMVMLWRGVLPRRRERRLVPAAAVLPLIPVAAISIAAKVVGEQSYYSLISRYTAVAAPFTLLVIAVVLVRAPKPAALALAAIAAVAIISGLSATYSSAGSQPNLRGAFSRVAEDARAGDSVALAGLLAARGESDYYSARLLRSRPDTAVVRMGGPAPALPHAGSRLWVLYDTGSAASIPPALQAAGWHRQATRLFNPGVAVTLALR